MDKQKQSMSDIEKALHEVAKAMESNDAVESIKITLTLKKAKPHKATKESK